MPFTVSCPACTARFSLGDDLYRRKVAGNLVTVKCRHCSAEIAVDATEPITSPTHEAPRRGPAPPRPVGASVTKMGLGVPTPPLAGQSATGTPIGLRVAGTPMPGGATASPLPLNTIATPGGLATASNTAALDSIWDDDDDQTLLINAPKAAPRVPAPPHPPHPPHPAKDDEPELIDAEEIPISSSDAPSLDTLKHEAARPELRRAKRAPDAFLVNLSAGTQGILGAPTIDVSSLDAPPSSIESIDVEEVVDDVEPQTARRPGRGGTQPLFDMSAVLPAVNDAAMPSNSRAATRAQAQASDAPASVSVPAPESKARERKYVVAPEAPTDATPKTRRAGAVVWFGLVAVAAGVVAVVGLRGHQSAAPVTSEPALEPSAAPVASVSSESESAKAAVAEPTAQSDVASTAPLPPEHDAPSAAPAKPAPASVTTTVSAPTPATATASVKPSPAIEKPAVTAEAAPAEEKPAIEKPAVASKPVEAHNAPPPAADGTEFDRAAARSALASAAAQASSCRKDGDPSGTATITITFAPSGRVTSANLQGPPFAGTATGGCIANTMRHASVPSFSGDYVTVTKNIVVQ